MMMSMSGVAILVMDVVAVRTIAGIAAGVMWITAGIAVGAVGTASPALTRALPLMKAVHIQSLIVKKSLKIVVSQPLPVRPPKRCSQSSWCKKAL
jgi:hypothetical protein